MKTTVVSHQSGTVRLQIDIDISGAMLAVEERIQDAVNDLGRAATGLALEPFDTDGSPVVTGPVKWTRRCRHPKTCQTPSLSCALSQEWRVGRAQCVSNQQRRQGLFAPGG